MKELFTIHGFEKNISCSEHRLIFHASNEELNKKFEAQQKQMEALQNQIRNQTELINRQNQTINQLSTRLNQPHMPQVQNQRVVQPSAITNRPSYNQDNQYTYRFPSTAPITRARVNYQSFIPSQYTSTGPRGYTPSGRRLTDSEHATKMIHRQHAGAPGSSNHYYIPGEQNTIFHRAMGGSGGYEGYDRYNNSRYSVTSRTPTERERKTQEQDQLTEFYADQLQNRDLPRLLDGIKSPYGKQKAEEILDNMERMMRKNPNKREYYYQLARARTLLEEIRRTEDQRTALEGNGRSPYENVNGLETYVNGELVPNNEVLIPITTNDPYKQIVITTPPDQYGKRGEILYSPHMDRALQYNARGGVSAMIENQIYIEKDRYYDGKVRGIKIKFGKAGTYNVDGRQVVVGKNPNEQENPEKQKPILRTLDVNAPFDVKRLYVIKAGKPNIPIDVSRLQNGKTLYWQDGIAIEKTVDGKLKVHFREQGSFDVLAQNAQGWQQPLGRYEVGGGMPKKDRIKTADQKEQNDIPVDNSVKQIADNKSSLDRFLKVQNSIAQNQSDDQKRTMDYFLRNSDLLEKLSSLQPKKEDNTVKLTIDNKKWILQTDSGLWDSVFGIDFRFSLKQEDDPLTSVVFEIPNRDISYNSSNQIQFGISRDFIEKKTKKAYEIRESERKDTAGISQFDVASQHERVGFVQMLDSHNGLISKIDREGYKQVLKKRYPDLYTAGNGKIDAQNPESAYTALENQISTLEKQGIKNFYIDVIAHGTKQGIVFGNKEIPITKMMNLFAAHTDCKFTVNTVACYGAGFADAMNAFIDSSTIQNRVTIFTQAKGDTMNSAQKTTDNIQKNDIDKNRLDTIYNAKLAQYLLQGIDSQYPGDRLSYGQAHLLADRDAKLVTRNDAEVWQSRKGQKSMNTADTQDARKYESQA